MNRSHALLSMVSLLCASVAVADIDVGSDGSDGVFSPQSNITIDLSQAAELCDCDGDTMALLSESTFRANGAFGDNVGAGQAGGAAYVANTTSVSVFSSDFEDNVADDGTGGAIHVAMVHAFLVRNSSFTNNTAPSRVSGGGALKLINPGFIEGSGRVRGNYAILFGTARPT